MRLGSGHIPVRAFGARFRCALYASRAGRTSNQKLKPPSRTRVGLVHPALNTYVLNSISYGHPESEAALCVEAGLISLGSLRNERSILIQFDEAS